jgi:hypothetical protein
MKFFGGIRKGKEDYYGTYYKNDNFSFYPSFHKANFSYHKAGYFDSRSQLNFTITTAIGLFGLLFLTGYTEALWFMVSMLVIILFIPWGQVYLRFPNDTGIEDCGESPSYGFYFYGEGQKIPDSFWIRKGKGTKCINLPWSYEWIRTSMLLKDKTWVHERRGASQDFYDSDKWKGILWEETYPYAYTYDNGNTEYPMATVKVSEREWRMRWFKWLPLFKKIRRSIDVKFHEEVGERRGSWKGGVVGTGHTMKKDETPLQCLQRMEKERKFN